MDRSINDKIYRFLFEHSFDAIFLTNPNGDIYRANPTACEMLQRSEQEICQIGRAGVVDLSDPRLEAALKERSFKGQVKAELNFKKKDGSIFPAALTSTIFKDETGEVWSVIVVRDISILKKAEATMQKAEKESAYFAAYDYLTGILNRRAFMEKLQQEIARADREKSPLSLLLLDVDHFKFINDNFGHIGGDLVLKKIAVCLAENLRPYDMLGRYGGDEFIIYMPGSTLAESVEVSERLRKQIEQMIFLFDDKQIKATISIGVACYNSQIKEDADRFILRADKNLYSAKYKRNSVFSA